MSYFVETVKRLMRENNLRQIDICQHTGLIASHFSHIINRKQKSIEPDDAAKIAQAVGKTPFEQAEVFTSYLRDQIPGFFKAASLIHIEIKPSTKSKNSESKFKLAPDVTEALAKIESRIPLDENMRELILRLGRIAG
jgi:transcriptional regulator with XRE-family HTH domain